MGPCLRSRWPSPQGTGSGLARLVGPELHAAHQGAQGLAVLHVAWVPSGQHVALGLLVEQPQDLLVVDLQAGVAGRGGSAGRGTSVQGSGQGEAGHRAPDLSGTAWESLPHLELLPFGEEHVPPELQGRLIWGERRRSPAGRPTQPALPSPRLAQSPFPKPPPPPLRKPPGCPAIGGVAYRKLLTVPPAHPSWAPLRDPSLLWGRCRPCLSARAAPPARGGLAGPEWARDRDAQAAALTHGHVIVRSVGESQQQFLPLAAQLVGLVLGLQLHFCRTRGEAAMKP